MFSFLLEMDLKKKKELIPYAINSTKILAADADVAALIKYGPVVIHFASTERTIVRLIRVSLIFSDLLET